MKSHNRTLAITIPQRTPDLINQYISQRAQSSASLNTAMTKRSHTINMNSTAQSVTELSMIVETSNSSSNNSDDNSKKRKATDDRTPQKQPKRNQTPTLATGFLVTGKWVDDVKFSCVKCRRGNRVACCEHARQGIPVVRLNKVGRPGAKEDKPTNKKCNCPKAQPCSCRHLSYILEEITVNGERKWRIQRAVWSNGRCELVSEFNPYDLTVAELAQVWTSEQ